MTSREPKNPRLLLLDDHARIDAALATLLEAVRANDRDGALKTWSKVENALLKHLDVEEMFVFPALRKSHPTEIDRLRAQHDDIRRSLGEIGLSLELHTARADAITAFCEALREHAEREESLAYQQAERALPVSVARSIAQRLRAAATSIRAPRARAAARAGAAS